MKWTTKPLDSFYIESAGKRASCMGYFGKGLEFWSYPLKLINSYRTEIYLPEKMQLIELKDFADSVHIHPEMTEVSYAHPLFTINMQVFTPVDAPGSFIVYKVDSSTPLRMILSFMPDLNLMWPGSIGGQHCFWYAEGDGFALYEPTRQFSGLIRMSGSTIYSTIGDHAFSGESYRMVQDIQEGYSEHVLSVFGQLGNLDECLKTLQGYEKSIEGLKAESKEYYEGYLERTLDIDVPDEDLKKLFTWGKISLVKGRVDNPLLGKGLTAGIGPSGKSTRPGFDWFFAGDMAINSLGMMAFGDFETIRESLLFYANYQKGDGRIPHEISQSAPLIDWFNRYQGFAYLHADTTAYYILALANYTIESGDRTLISELADILEKALDFCTASSEEETGLILNEKAGLGALEIGEFRKPKYDIYTNGIWAAALQRLALAYSQAGFESESAEIRALFSRISESLELFWNEEGSYYCLSVLPDGKQLKPLMSMASIPVAFGLLNDLRSRLFVEKIKESTLTVPWGIRSVEEGRHYDPINYNFGSIWHFFNGFAAMAAFNKGDYLFGFRVINAAAKAFINENTTHMPELFSGDRFSKVTTAVPHQLFSLGPILWAIASGLFGVSRNALTRKVTVSPKVPASWDGFSLKNLALGHDLINLKVSFGSKNTVTVSGNISEPFLLEFVPPKSYLGESYVGGKPVSSILIEVKGDTVFSYTQTGVRVQETIPLLKKGMFKKEPKLLQIAEENGKLELLFYGLKDQSAELQFYGEELKILEDHQNVTLEDGCLRVLFSKDGTRSITLAKKT